MAYLPAEICLDTVTLTTWIRVALGDQIIEGRINDGCAFFVETTVVDEATRRLGAVGVALVDSVLNLGVEVVDMESDDSADWLFAARLARVMADAQIAAGEVVKPPRSANLGEATSIVYIKTKRPDAMFVTSDRQAEAMARAAGILVARTCAFFGIEIELGKLTFDDLWAAVCDTRNCAQDSLRCKAQGLCPSLSDEAVERGVLGHVAKTRERLRTTVLQDVHAMQLALGVEG